MIGFLDKLFPQRTSVLDTMNELDLITVAKTPGRKIGAKGAYNRRIVRTEIVGEHEWSLHATKGWRRRRIN